MPSKLSREHEIDLRTAAYHEAAHAVVAHAGGYLLPVMIYLFPRKDPQPNETTVAGNAQFFGPLEPEVAAIVAWAGALAGELQIDPSMTEDELESPDIQPSPTDLELLGGVPPPAQVRARRDAWRAIQANWTEITKLAEQLIENYRLTRDVRHTVISPTMLRQALAQHEAGAKTSPRRRGR